MLIFASLIVALVAVHIAAGPTGCETQGTFKNEKGSFEMSWCYPDADDIEITFTLEGKSFIALGFGGSMYDADMVVGWIGADGSPVISDYYSNEESMPKVLNLHNKVIKNLQSLYLM